ncbi:hypothetical protein [Candidatus Phytoplasma australiense]|uniref:Uncharacterized protein n=1 Tax=Strawberry lethal yellows phytoplasma (CPA) str. NZSb11 TaxID=980422 RepID=R4RWJ5_PHYAS|nr:hypothetical protein [Candidatus Phytoplasma australiense]AGL90242.1 Hypothetical Protein SLY_0320 [Strawberry lethal yellows phytoplasma (CPA) str. NZSb11]
MALSKNANANTVKQYIKENINSSFDGYVKSKPSYNSSRNDSIYWL